MTEEKRAYLIRAGILTRFKIAVTLASQFKLQNILAMPDEARTNMATEFFANGMTSRLLAVNGWRAPGSSNGQISTRLERGAEGALPALVGETMVASSLQLCGLGGYGVVSPD